VPHVVDDDFDTRDAYDRLGDPGGIVSRNDEDVAHTSFMSGTRRAVNQAFAPKFGELLR
jgi:hypothetical protein